MWFQMKTGVHVAHYEPMWFRDERDLENFLSADLEGWDALYQIDA